jgi:hypothetical protein
MDIMKKFFFLPPLIIFSTLYPMEDNIKDGIFFSPRIHKKKQGPQTHNIHKNLEEINNNIKKLIKVSNKLEILVNNLILESVKSSLKIKPSHRHKVTPHRSSEEFGLESEEAKSDQSTVAIEEEIIEAQKQIDNIKKRSGNHYTLINKLTPSEDLKDISNLNDSNNKHDENPYRLANQLVPSEGSKDSESSEDNSEDSENNWSIDGFNVNTDNF